MIIKNFLALVILFTPFLSKAQYPPNNTHTHRDLSHLMEAFQVQETTESRPSSVPPTPSSTDVQPQESTPDMEDARQVIPDQSILDYIPREIYMGEAYRGTQDSTPFAPNSPEVQPAPHPRAADPTPTYIPLYGVCSIQGQRSTMEDAHQVIPDLATFFDSTKKLSDGKRRSYYAVFDGHGGARAAQYAANNLHLNLIYDQCFPNNITEALRKAFVKTDKNFIARGYNDGSTAIVAVRENNTLYLANLGDSRAVLEENGKVGFATKDHKPNDPDERRRIEAAGGTVLDDKRGGVVLNARGQLAMSRAFGNRNYKKTVMSSVKNIIQNKLTVGSIVSNEPTITCLQLTPQNTFLILASDGIWNVIENQEAVALVKKELEQHLDPQKASKALVDEAFKRKSSDNITALIVLLNVKPR